MKNVKVLLGLSACLLSASLLLAQDSETTKESPASKTEVKPANPYESLLDHSKNELHLDKGIAPGNRNDDPPAARGNQSRILVAKNFGKSEEQIEAALNTITVVEFPGNPLGDVLTYLGNQFGIPITLDQTLADVNDIANAEVSIVVSGVTLKDVLNLMLRDVEGRQLAPLIADGVLLITAREVAGQHYETRVYDVRPLQITDPDQLVQMIESCISGLWGDQRETGFDEAGKMQRQSVGRAAFFEGSLIVLQTQAGHDEVEATLNGLLRFVQANPTYRTPVRPAALDGGQQNSPGVGYF